MNLRLHQSARIGLGVVASFAVATVATAWIGHGSPPSLCDDCDLATRPAPIIASPATDTATQWSVASSYARTAAASAVPFEPEATGGFGMVSTAGTSHLTTAAARVHDDHFAAPEHLQGAAAAGSGGGGSVGRMGGSGGGIGGGGRAPGSASTHAHSTSAAPHTPAIPKAHSTAGAVSHSSAAASASVSAAPSTIAADMTAATPAASVSAGFSEHTSAPSISGITGTSSSAIGAGRLGSVAIGGHALSATPEPGTLFLVLTGAIGLLRWKRYEH